MSPPASLPPAVLRALASVRRRRRALAALEAASYAAAALGALALMLPLVPAESSGALQLVAQSAVLLAVLVPSVAVLLPVVRRTSSLLAVARAVDDRVPATADALFAAVDLAAALDAERIPPGSEPSRLARAHLDAASRAARSVRPEQLLPVAGLPRAARLAPAILLLALLGFQLRPEPFLRGWGALFGPAPADKETVAAEPPVTLVLRNVVVHLTPPAYARREAMVLEGSAGDIVALPGTLVRIEADGVSGGRGARAVLAGRAEPTAGTVDGDRLVLEFVTRLETNYRIEVDRTLGRAPLRTRAFVIEALPDRPPELEVLAPGGELVLRPGEELPVEVRARDDFRLSRLERVVLRDGVEVERSPIADVTGRASHDELLRWSPGELGGELELVVEAWDDDTVLGPKKTSSRPIPVRVPTALEQARKVLIGKEELLAQALDLLADLLVEGALPVPRDERADVLAAHDRQQRLADAFLAEAGRLLAAMAESPLETARAVSGVAGLTENVEARWRAVVELVDREVRDEKATRVHRAILAGLGRARGEVVSELERAVLDLASFVDVQKGQEVQRDLAALADRMAETQALMRRAAAGEPVSAELDAALADLARRMAEIAEKLAERQAGPDDGFVNRLPAELGASALEEIRELLRQGRYDEAMAKLAEADAALAALEAELQQEAGDSAGGPSSAELDAALQAAIDEAKALEAKQQGVNREMGELAERFPAGGDRGAGAQEKLRALRERVDRLGEGPGDGGTMEALRRTRLFAQRDLQAIEQALAEGAPDEAAAHAREIERATSEAAAALRASPAPGATEGREAARSAARSAGELAAALAQQEAAQREAQREAQRAGQGARGRQGAVAEGVAGLRERAEGLPGSAFNPAAGRDSLQNAEQLLRRAEGRLGEGDPTRAESAGEDGLRQIQEFRQGLEGAQQALRQTGPPRPGGGGRSGAGQQAGGPQRSGSDDGVQGDNRGSVELTDPDEFVGPEAWRALLLEGAQGEAPERYEPLNGSYYEELLR